MEATFVGIMTLHALIKVLYNEPDLTTYHGFEVHLPGNGVYGVYSDFPPYDYQTAIRLAFDSGYFPLFDKSVKRFVDDGGILCYDGDYDT